MAYAYSSAYAKPPPPKAAQKLNKQRDFAEYASFEVRGLHVPSDPQSTRIAQGHRGSVKAMAFTPSGSLLATAGLDKTVRFWDVKGLGNEGSRRRDEAITFSYNTSRSPLLPIASTSSSASSSSASSSKTTSESTILRLAFSPVDEDLLAVACAARSTRDRERDRKDDGPSVVLWNISKSNPHIIATFPLDGEFQTFAFHPSGYQLGIACFRRSAWDAVMFIWNEECARSEERRRLNVGVDEDVTMDSGGDKKESRWSIRRDVKLGDRNYRLRDRRGKEWGVRELNGMCFSPCGTRVFAGETSGNIFAWEYPILPPIDTTVQSADVPEETAPDEGVEEGKDLATAQPSGTVTPARSGDGRNGSPESEERAQEDGEMVNGEENAEKMDEKMDDTTEEPATAGKTAGADEGAMKEANGDAVQLVEKEEPKQENAEESAADPAMDGQDQQEEAAPPTTAANGDVDMTDSQDDATSSSQVFKDVEDPAASEETVPASSTLDGQLVNGGDEEVDGETDAEMVDAAMEREVEPPAASIAPPQQHAESTAEQETTAPSEEAKHEAPKAEAEDTKMTEDKPAPEPIAPAEPSVPTAPAEPSKPKVPEIQAKMLKYLFQVGCHSGCANCLEIAPNGRFVATGGSEGVVNQVDLNSWITVRAYDSYTEEVRMVKCSYDGEWIAVTGDDRCIDIMSVATGTTVVRIPTKTKVECMAWVPSAMKSVLCYALEDHPSGAAGQAGDWLYVTL